MDERPLVRVGVLRGQLAPVAVLVADQKLRRDLAGLLDRFEGAGRPDDPPQLEPTGPLQLLGQDLAQAVGQRPVGQRRVGKISVPRDLERLERRPPLASRQVCNTESG